MVFVSLRQNKDKITTQLSVNYHFLYRLSFCIKLNSNIQSNNNTFFNLLILI